MNAVFTRRLLFLALFLTSLPGLHRVMGQDVILQGFYWNTHPGDVTNTTTGGIWWDTLTLVAPQLKSAGFSTVWTPPPTKSFAGVWDMGYGMYDYFDLGDYNSKGTTRTRHGSRAELNAMIAAMHANDVKVMADIVLNHRGGADAQAPYQISGYGTGYNVFNPPSTRIPGGPEDVHPTNQHPDLNPDYHNRIFFEDICHFNESDAFPPTNPDGTAGNWFFGAPTICGSYGDSLIMWTMDSIRSPCSPHANRASSSSRRPQTAAIHSASPVPVRPRIPAPDRPSIRPEPHSHPVPADIQSA